MAAAALGAQAEDVGVEARWNSTIVMKTKFAAASPRCSRLFE
jgi:hypothetical protein